MKALSTKTCIPSSTLIQAVRGGNVELQGTWVHPYVAVNLAQWANPEVAVDVSIWIAKWMNGNLNLKQ